MAEDTARQSRSETIDLILSCSICQDTLSAIYTNHENNDGLRQGKDNTDGAIVKLWLTECAHITCAKHLEGGGVPFHPQDQPPKAPCPLCLRNNQDHTDKILYAIRGSAKGQYDNRIPADYFRVPPPQLGHSDNEALRFQYVSLIRFASGVHERLLVSERELHTWKDREHSIVACLAAMEPVSKALQMARDKLYGLSADVSFIDNALQLAASLRVNSAVPEDRPATSTTHDVQTQSASENIPAESLLARGSAMDLQSIQSGVRVLDEWDSPLTVEAAQYNNETSTKRRRLGAAENYDIEQQHGSDPQSLQQRLASRDIMPPPSRRLVKEGLSNASKQWLSGRLTSTSSAPRQFSWLTAPLGQSQHQGHQRSYGGELLDGSVTGLVEKREEKMGG
ncbi:MAG: hypothetical protein L6R40_002670 [Gallowayella cf. fulva]|nr:MAG: hypothetical protein L6R40_002670 [Xanthomendoza cf. fulva]